MSLHKSKCTWTLAWTVGGAQLYHSVVARKVHLYPGAAVALFRATVRENIDCNYSTGGKSILHFFASHANIHAAVLDLVYDYFRNDHRSCPHKPDA